MRQFRVGDQVREKGKQYFMREFLRVTGTCRGLFGQQIYCVGRELGKPVNKEILAEDLELYQVPFEWTDELVKYFITKFWTLTNLETAEAKIDYFKEAMTPGGFKAKRGPDWEIMEYIQYAQLTDLPPQIFTQNHPGWNMAVVRGEPIHKVRRLSDGKVFTVGDRLESEGHTQIIERFMVTEDFMEVIFDSGIKVNLSTPFRPAMDDLPPAANEKVPVWLTPAQVKRLEGLLSEPQDVALPGPMPSIMEEAEKLLDDYQHWISIQMAQRRKDQAEEALKNLLK